MNGYRAPSWSITTQSIWALDILQECGFSYDSSVFPIHHDIYGLPGAQRFPYVHILANKTKLPEFSPTTVQGAGMVLPAAGGGYLRLMPVWYTDRAFRQTDAEGQKVIVYFHPWELDPEQPRIEASFRSRFRHYTNLKHMESRLQHLMQSYKFKPLGEFVKQLHPTLPLARAA
jgi:polysaccharide deacetylase family protein (PEP-CTERM system associated)